MRCCRATRDAAGRPRPQRHAWSRFDDGVLDVGLRTDGRRGDLAAVDARERHSPSAPRCGRCSRPRRSPSSAPGRAAGGIGHEMLRAMRDFGFTGRLYAVNPHAAEVAGVPAYRSCANCPARSTWWSSPYRRRRCRRGRRRGRDRRARRRRAHRRLRRGRRGRARPGSGNSSDWPAGTASGWSARTASASSTPIRRSGSTPPSPRPPPAGGLAVASQSGAVGIALLDHAARTGCGVSTFVSLGNKADVSGNDLIAYWYDDPATHAVALYLESFGNPRRFARTVRALARRKPVLAVKSGRSAAGRRAGASHTAAAAAPGRHRGRAVRAGRRHPHRQPRRAARRGPHAHRPAAAAPATGSASSATPAASTCSPPTPPRPAA